ncbi:MAG: hypothetical protein J5585_05055 [Clostridia bacterium]|nr:hypothetical protein [Clostridia bacterium]
MSSDKLSFKDALIEAGVRDYYATEKDKTWAPSGKLESGMEKLIEKQGPARRFFGSPLFKGVAVAASLAVLFGVLASVKPVRQGVASAIGRVFGAGEDSETVAGTADPADTETESVPVTTDAPVIEQTTEAETAADTGAAVYENEIERCLMLLQDPYKYDEAREYLFNQRDAEDVFKYCVVLMAENERDEGLLNCAGRFIYEFYCMNMTYDDYISSDRQREDIENIAEDTSAEGQSTKYIRWYSKYYETLSEKAKDLSESTAKKCEYAYYMLKKGGFKDWSAIFAETAEEGVRNTLTALFELYNAVRAGIPPQYCETVKISPSSEALADLIRSYWGEEEREFVRVTNMSADEFRKKFGMITSGVNADLFIASTKYFIICGENVYMTRAKDTDADAHTYVLDEITMMSDTSPTMRSLRGSAKVLRDGAEKTYYYNFTEAYTYNKGYKCVLSRGDEAIEDVFRSRGDETVGYAIETYAANGTKAAIAYSLCTDDTEFRQTALDYILAHYFAETDVNVRAAMGTMFYEITLRYRSGLLQTVPDVKELFSLPEDKGELAGFIEKCAGVFKKVASQRHKIEFMTDYPDFYKLLCAVGFNGYIPGDPDISFYARDAIKAAGELYDAVTYGWAPDALIGKWHVIENDEQREGLPERMREEYSAYYALSDFYAYFDKYIPREITDGSLHNSFWFNVIDDRVYMFDPGPQSVVRVNYRTAKLIEKKGNTAKIAVDVSIPHGMFSAVRNLTFEIEEYPGGIRVTGGEFVERILKYEYGIAGSVSYVIQTYMLLREGQYEYNSYTNRALYNSYDEVPEKDRNVLTKDLHYPLFYAEGYYREYELDRDLTKEGAAALIKATDVFDGVALYPDKAKAKHTPAFEYGIDFDEDSFEAILTYDVILAMNVIEYSDDRILFSLDFVKEENGESKNVTYTFEVTKTHNSDEDEYGTLTGGTFLTDLIMAK